MAHDNNDKKAKKMAINRRWLYTLITVPVLLLLAFGVISALKDVKDIPSVANPVFALNGEEFPTAPVLQDFVDRGWKRGEPAEQMGDWTQQEGASNLVVTGYNLSSGKDKVIAYLDRDDVTSGAEPDACRLRSLSLYGEDVDSFCIDGKELSGTDSSRIVELLGEPDKVDEQPNGTFYHYSMPEKGIDEITFTFPNTLDAVAQIFIIFDY